MAAFHFFEIKLLRNGELTEKILAKKVGNQTADCWKKVSGLKLAERTQLFEAAAVPCAFAVSTHVNTAGSLEPTHSKTFCTGGCLWCLPSVRTPTHSRGGVETSHRLPRGASSSQGSDESNQPIESEGTVPNRRSFTNLMSNRPTQQLGKGRKHSVYHGEPARKRQPVSFKAIFA